jgi:hypothetical protein
MDVRMPDGTVVTGVPEGTTRAQLEAKLGAQAAPKPPEKMSFMQALTGDLSDMAGGLYGAAKRIVTAPGDAMAGKFNALGPEGRERATEFAGAVSPMSAASRAGELMKMRKVIPDAPTAEELAKATSAGYNKMRESGVSVTSEALRDFAANLKQKLAEGFHSDATDPKTFAKLDEIAAGPAGSYVDIGFLDKFRQKLGEIAGGDESRSATLAIKELDGFLDNLAPQSVRTDTQALALPGSVEAGSGVGAREAIDILKQARGNAAAGFRSDAVTGLERSVENRAASVNSGQNVGNTIRSRLASLLDKNNGTRGWSPEEIQAAEGIVRGDRTMNTARYIGNLLGGGGGAGQTLTGVMGAGVGGAYGGLTGAALGASPALVGAGSRAAYNRMARNRLNALDELIRSRSPLAEQRKAAAGSEPVVSDRAAALARLLAISSQEQTQ